MWKMVSGKQTSKEAYHTAFVSASSRSFLSLSCPGMSYWPCNSVPKVFGSAWETSTHCRSYQKVFYKVLWHLGSGWEIYQSERLWKEDSRSLRHRLLNSRYSNIYSFRRRKLPNMPFLFYLSQTPAVSSPDCCLRRQCEYLWCSTERVPSGEFPDLPQPLQRNYQEELVSSYRSNLCSFHAGYWRAICKTQIRNRV